MAQTESRAIFQVQWEVCAREMAAKSRQDVRDAQDGDDSPRAANGERGLRLFPPGAQLMSWPKRNEQMAW